jgi:hypothetical protein
VDNKLREGWVCLFDTPELKTSDGTVHSFKKGDTLPSWLYASFDRAARKKYFKRNDELLGQVYGSERTR